MLRRLRSLIVVFILALQLQLQFISSSSSGNTYEFSRDYFGVSFSPYTKDYEFNSTITLSWGNYTLEDVKVLLKAVSKRVSNIATYSSGTHEGNLNSTWDKGHGNAFVARAAALINKEARTKVLSMAQGIYQSYSWSESETLWGQKEIEYGFQEAEDANSIYPGTVWGVIIYHLHTSNEDDAQKTLDTIRRLKDKARSLKLKIGTRVSNCGEINGGELKEFIMKIAMESDFLMCAIHPKDERGTKTPVQVVKEIGEQFWKFATPLKKLNPSLEVMIGDTAWPSQGVSYSGTNNSLVNMRDYWHGMNEWATTNKIRVQIFGAFDEPWKTNIRSTDPEDPSGTFGSEAHFGWWKLLNNNITEGNILEKVSEIPDNNPRIDQCPCPCACAKP